MSNKHNTKTKILMFLLSHKNQQFTINNIAKSTSVDYKAVYLEVQKLIKNSIIDAKTAGHTTLCSLMPKKFDSDIFIAEYVRREELFKNKNFKVLCSYFQEIKEPFFIFLLFGSYASGKTRRNSDIDIMLIVDNEKLTNQIKNKTKLIPLNIQLVTFTSEEFLSQLRTTEFNVGKEAFNNNIVLFGIENYYRLIQNA